MILQPIPPDRVDEAWPVLRPFAEMMAARWPEDWPADEIRRSAVNGVTVLWAAWSPKDRKVCGIVGTQMGRKAAGRKVLSIVITAGDARECATLVETLEDYGRANGCASVEIHGRAGWLRRLSGYQLERRPILTKVL